MKRINLILGALMIGGIFLFACKKDTGNTCICKINGDEVGRYDLGKQSRKDAEDACEAKTITFAVIAECYLE